jgi:hypothetical protein
MISLAPMPLSACQTSGPVDEARAMGTSEAGSGSVQPGQGGREHRQPRAADGDRRIRVRNASTVDFGEVRVFFPDDPAAAVSYGAVKAGAASDYKPVGRAYRYAHIEATAGEREFVLRPIDYVGEAELPAGRFTYVLSIAADRLAVNLERDG